MVFTYNQLEFVNNKLTVYFIKFKESIQERAVI